MYEDEEELTAWHEAGHATMAVLCGGYIERVTIEPPNDDGPNRYGDTITLWRGLDSSQLACAEIRVSLAGPIVEMLFCGERLELDRVQEWSSDWKTAFEAAVDLCNDQSKARKFLNDVATEVHDQFNDDHLWAAVGAVADDLLAHETLEHEQVAETVGFWQRR